MSDREQDPVAALGEEALEMSKKLAEGYKVLAQFLLERYKNSNHYQRQLDEKDQKEKLNNALKEGGFEVSDGNRQKLKAWSDAYEKNNELQLEKANELNEANKQIDKLETINKLSPEEQQKRGYGSGDGLKDPSKELDGLLSKKLEVNEKIEGLQEEAKALEQGKGLEVLKPEEMSIKEKLGAKLGGKSESQGAEKGQTSLKGGKEPRPGSVFDSLVKSGYMEKGGLSFMNDNAIGQNANKQGAKPKLK